MKSQQHAHFALNLSYVLHERSDSDTVRRYVRAREAEQRRCSKASRDLSRLSDAELLRRLVILDNTTELISVESNGIRVVSVDIGACELLPRLLHVTGIVKPDLPNFGSLLDVSDSSDERALPLFGAPARLKTPDSPAGFGGRMLFASAVFRPGYTSILLRATLLDSDNETGAPDWQRAAHLAEEVIREFPLQWWCTRPLWSRPVEETLPEFRSTGNGTTVCGR